LGESSRTKIIVNAGTGTPAKLGAYFSERKVFLHLKPPFCVSVDAKLPELGSGFDGE